MEKQIIVVQMGEEKIYAIAPADFAVIGDEVEVTDYGAGGIVVDQVADYGGDVIRLLSYNNILYAGVEKTGGAEDGE